MLEAIERANKELGTTTISITHNVVISDMADRVITLADGQVKLGQRNGLEAEILEGLPEGSQVISHPSNQIINGIRIKPRD